MSDTAEWREIPLTRGRFALVDEADYDRVVAAGKWHVLLNGQRAYGMRTTRVGGRKRNVYLHVFLTGWSLTDHINGNGLDNRRANLRPATPAENARNQRIRRDGTSGFKGVGPRRGKWRARISADGDRRNLGVFATPEEAARAYDAAARDLFGEFALEALTETTEEKT